MCHLILCLFLTTTVSINSVLTTNHLMENAMPLCTNYFDYKLDEKKPYGIIEIPNERFHKTLHIRVNMALQSLYHHGNTMAKLHQIHTGIRLLQEIMAGHPIVYRLDLPKIQTPLPIITKIIFNGETVCSDDHEHHRMYATMYLERYYIGPDLTSVDAGMRQQLDNAHLLHEKSSTTTIIQTATDQPVSIIRNNYSTSPNDNDYASASLANSQNNRHAHPSTEYNHNPLIAKYSSNGTYQSITQQCGEVNPDTVINARILDGVPSVERGAFPWLAAFYQNVDATLVFMCGGNLVSQRLIVTAAHCAYGPRGSVAAHTPDQLVASLGRSNIHRWGEPGSIVVDIEMIVAHPDWRHDIGKTMDADVAVVQLNARIQFSRFVRPICLWSGGDDLNDIIGEYGTVAGWGMQANGLKYSAVLQSIELPIVSEVQCIRAGEVFRQITSNRTICVGKNDGSGPCEGDSGVAFAMLRNGRWVLRGIVSTAVHDPMTVGCDLKQYVVLTDATKFGEWIRSFL